MLSRKVVGLVLGGSIALGLAQVGSIAAAAVQPNVRVVAQAQRSDELERAIVEGFRLFREGSKASLIAAIQQFEKALKLSRATDQKSQQALALLGLGRVYDVLGEKAKALEYYNQSLSLWRAVGDKAGTAAALNNIGNVYDVLGEKAKALEYYNQSLSLWHAVGDKAGAAATLNNIGGAYNDLGEKAKALEYYNQSLSLRRATGDREGLARMLNNIGGVYNDLGEKAKALEYYNQSLPLWRAVGNRAGIAATLNGIGLVYSDFSNKKAKALEYYNQSLPLWRAVGDRAGEAATLNNIGLVYSDLGEKAEALKYYNQSLPLRRAVGDRAGEATTLNNIGGVYDDLGEKAKALEYYNQSLPLWRAVGNRAREGITLNNIGYLFSKDQPDVAIVFLKQSVNLFESLRKDIRKLPRETQEIYTSSVATTYRKLADILLTQGRTREAQIILELLKVQESQSYGKGQDNSPPIQFPFHPLESQALQSFEKSIASKTLSLDTLLTIAQPLSQNRDRIIQDSNNTPSAIGNPQAVLQAHPNALLIQNLVVGDKLWVIWTNASGKTTAIVVPNVTQTQLTATVDQFRKQLDSPYSDLKELQTNSTKLYNWLIPPQLQAELAQNPQQHLIFSLDHVTRYIPVAVLFDGKQYLAQRYVLSNLITTASDTTDRLSLKGQTPTILALGTSKAFPPSFSALPNVPAELNAIVRDGNDKGIYPGKIRLDAAFTANSLRDNRNPFRVLHIATHGSFNPKTITASFLLLGDGNQLPIADIENLTNLNTTHLVVLSACQTGLSGSAPDGTEISGLSGYFLYRGAKAVVASLWSVNDASTTLLMQQFYQNLAQGMAKSEALRQAQLSLLSNTVQPPSPGNRLALHPKKPNQPTRKDQLPPGYTHPYYWAPFILIGNGL